MKDVVEETGRCVSLLFRSCRNMLTEISGKTENPNILRSSMGRAQISKRSCCFCDLADEQEVDEETSGVMI